MANLKFSDFTAAAAIDQTDSFLVGFDNDGGGANPTNNKWTFSEVAAGLNSTNSLQNIYNVDGTLAGDRTITLSGNVIKLEQGGTGNFMHMNGTSNNAYFIQGRYNTQIKANLGLNTGSGRLELYAAGGTKYVDLNPQGSVNYLLDKTIIGANTGTPVERLEVNGNCKITGQAYTELHTGTTPLDPDWNNGNVQESTLTSGSSDFDPTNPKAGATYILKLTQPGSGAAGTVNWDNIGAANIKWPGGTEPTLTATNGAVDIITLICTDSTGQGVYYANATLDFQ